MKIAPESKSCSFKGNQKVFYLHINRAASCCRSNLEILDASQDLNLYLEKWQHESRQLDSGVEIPGCNYCWKSERNGQISYRFSKIDPAQIELFLSNLCNQMCSYCSPKFSSTWQQSINQIGMLTNISSTAKNNLQPDIQSADTTYWIDQISQYISSCPDHSITVKLLGGEPLMQQRNLEKLLSLNSHKIKKLLLGTNLNPPTDKFLKWLLSNIDANTLDFDISIDSSPEYNHWPRALFDREKFLNNLQLVKQHRASISVSSVVSVMSIFDLENFILWLNNNQLTPGFTKLNNPDCLDPTLVPQVFRKQIWEQIKHLNPPVILQEILQQQDNPNHIRMIEQLNYLSQYFERNSMDPMQCSNGLFKEYWNWLTQNYKK
jgi:organic radical activating enzyme